MVHRLVFGFVVSSSKDCRKADIVIYGLFCKVKQPTFFSSNSLFVFI